MKNFKYLSILLLAFIHFSCSSDHDAKPENSADETSGLLKIQEVSNDNHTIELYSETGKLTQGYNSVFLRIKDKTTSKYITDAALNWTPVMNMTTMKHSCPKSSIEKTTGKKTLYEGNIIFQMAQNATEFWELKFNYSIKDVNYTAVAVINVTAYDKRNVSSFKGTDGTNYVLALINPQKPKVGINDMSAALYKMEDMMTFTVVDNFKVKIDPRMPGMGNHSSPNNIDLTQSESKGSYKGKLSLTMTGYWKINLQLLNAAGEVLKGEECTAENLSSSLFFEVEF